MKTIQIALAALLVLAVAALAGAGRPEAAQGTTTDREGITVTGTGEARTTPDRASLSFGIHTDGATAAKASAANAQQARRVIDALKRAGVAAKDLKTEHLDVSPRYDPEKVQEARNYQANTMITVSNQPLDRAAKLVDVGTAAGADSVSGPSLSVAEPKSQYRQALEAAFADARAKAQVLAAAAGVSLGAVTAIAEGSYPTPVPFAAAESARALDTPIEPGTENLTAVVTVTFAIS